MNKIHADQYVPIIEVTAILLSVDNRPIRSTYETLDEALAVAAAYRAAGFYARTTVR